MRGGCRAYRPELIGAAKQYPWIVPTTVFALLVVLGIVIG